MNSSKPVSYKALSLTFIAKNQASDVGSFKVLTDFIEDEEKRTKVWVYMKKNMVEIVKLEFPHAVEISNWKKRVGELMNVADYEESFYKVVIKTTKTPVLVQDAEVGDGDYDYEAIAKRIGSISFDELAEVYSTRFSLQELARFLNLISVKLGWSTETIGSIMKEYNGFILKPSSGYVVYRITETLLERIGFESDKSGLDFINDFIEKYDTDVKVSEECDQDGLMVTCAARDFHVMVYKILCNSGKGYREFLKTMECYMETYPFISRYTPCDKHTKRKRDYIEEDESRSNKKLKTGSVVDDEEWYWAVDLADLEDVEIWFDESGEVILRDPKDDVAAEDSSPVVVTCDSEEVAMVTETPTVVSDPVVDQEVVSEKSTDSLTDDDDFAAGLAMMKKESLKKTEIIFKNEKKMQFIVDKMLEHHTNTNKAIDMARKVSKDYERNKPMIGLGDNKENFIVFGVRDGKECVNEASRATLKQKMRFIGKVHTVVEGFPSHKGYVRTMIRNKLIERYVHPYWHYSSKVEGKSVKDLYLSCMELEFIRCDGDGVRYMRYLGPADCDTLSEEIDSFKKEVNMNMKKTLEQLRVMTKDIESLYDEI